MPSGRKAQSREDAWAAAEELGLPVVVKPQDANHGRGVSIRLEDRSAVEAAFDITATDKISVRAGLATKTQDYIARRIEIDYATYARYRGKITMK